jgi:hypothetical protein
MRTLVTGLAALSFLIIGSVDASAHRICKPKRHYKPAPTHSHHHRPRSDYRPHFRPAPVYAYRPQVWVVPQPVVVYMPPPVEFAPPGYYGSAAGRVLVLY